RDLRLFDRDSFCNPRFLLECWTITPTRLRFHSLNDPTNPGFRWPIASALANHAVSFIDAGGANPKSPELLWVIAFVGSFSDTLSINLLQRVLGQSHVAGEDSKKQQENVKSSTGKSGG